MSHRLSAEPMSDYEKNQKEIKKIIAKAAKGGNKVLEEMAKEDKVMDDKGRLRNIELAHQVFGESISMYREGEIKTFKEMVKDLEEALNEVETEDEGNEEEDEDDEESEEVELED